ncbi:uncharacterized protein BDZ99DRAFT_495625 [Mytilinidion resinicola]|uniref:Uncharacterized protein n=1 Tax=Mytilinidion resinicola TaxID=574789 RepID=A0A6A6Z1A4_9PEZI|nr:uncharacterized protein BDZ99DRAFT_495625 [Mytilinidion resinicola]KAF2814064.1 hypothetical protein BDZ99DRAFT_495625 [Mytilinidion resinicola]
MADEPPRNLFTTVFRPHSPFSSSSSFSSAPPPSTHFPDGTPRTIYRSKNNTTGAEFSCTAPAGSKHAQAMRELCASVQGVGLPQASQPQPQPRYQRQLPTTSSAPGMTTDAHDAQVQRQTQAFEEGRGGGGAGVIRTVSKAAAGSRRNPRPPKLQYRNGSGSASAAEGGTVFRRVEDERSVTFVSKSAQGEVFVAAPKGSQEAEAHERMARGLNGGERREGAVKAVSSGRRWAIGWLGS